MWSDIISWFLFLQSGGVNEWSMGGLHAFVLRSTWALYVSCNLHTAKPSFKSFLLYFKAKNTSALVRESLLCCIEKKKLNPSVYRKPPQCLLQLHLSHLYYKENVSCDAEVCRTSVCVDISTTPRYYSNYRTLSVCKQSNLDDIIFQVVRTEKSKHLLQ